MATRRSLWQASVLPIADHSAYCGHLSFPAVPMAHSVLVAHSATSSQPVSVGRRGRRGPLVLARWCLQILSTDRHGSYVQTARLQPLPFNCSKSKYTFWLKTLFIICLHLRPENHVQSTIQQWTITEAVPLGRQLLKFQRQVVWHIYLSWEGLSQACITIHGTFFSSTKYGCWLHSQAIKYAHILYSIFATFLVSGLLSEGPRRGANYVRAGSECRVGGKDRWVDWVFSMVGEGPSMSYYNVLSE